MNHLLGARLHSIDGSTSSLQILGPNFKSQLGHIIFVGIDHEIISVVILTISLIQDDGCQLLANVCAQSTG